MEILLWSKQSVISRSNRVKSSQRIPIPDRFVTKKPAMKVHSQKVGTMGRGLHVDCMDIKVRSKDTDIACLTKVNITHD
jgi:hypothetical protein